MALAVRPIDTPMAVTMPGQYRQISMIGISAMPPPSPLERATGSTCSPASMARSRSMRRVNESRAIESMPNVAKSLRRMS
jgi:hypothetical protein